MSMFDVSGIPAMGVPAMGGAFGGFQPGGSFGGWNANQINASMGMGPGGFGDQGQAQLNNIFSNFGKQTDYYSGLGAAFGRNTGGFGGGGNPAGQVERGPDLPDLSQNPFGDVWSRGAAAVPYLNYGGGGGKSGGGSWVGGNPGAEGGGSPTWVPDFDPGQVQQGPSPSYTPPNQNSFASRWNVPNTYANSGLPRGIWDTSVWRGPPAAPAASPPPAWEPNDAGGGGSWVSGNSGAEGGGGGMTWVPSGKGGIGSDALRDQFAWQLARSSPYAGPQGAPNTQMPGGIGYNPGRANEFANPAMGGGAFQGRYGFGFPGQGTPSQYTASPYTNSQGRTFQPNMPPGFMPQFDVDNPQGALPWQGTVLDNRTGG